MPDIAERVFDHPAAIAIRHVPGFFDGHCAGFHRPLISRVGIIDIEVQKSRRRVAGANAAYHDERVANFHHGRHFCSEVSCRAERLLEELD